MTIQESIEKLREFCKLRAFCELYPDACRKEECEIYLAIEALHRCSEKSNRSEIVSNIQRHPSAQPDLSEYSDKLWKAAYERGKADAQSEIIRCKDCKWFEPADSDEDSNWCFCWENICEENAFCSYAERKEDEVN